MITKKEIPPQIFSVHELLQQYDRRHLNAFPLGKPPFVAILWVRIYVRVVSTGVEWRICERMGGIGWMDQHDLGYLIPNSSF